MPWNFNPQPQSKAEFQKNEKRIKDLVAKCGGDKQKEINKAFEMAVKITTPEKAYNRGHVARELGYEHIFNVFYERAYELGSVSTAEHRDHQIDKILNDDEVSDYVIPEKKVKVEYKSCLELLKHDNENFTEVTSDKIPENILNSIVEIIKLNSRTKFTLTKLKKVIKEGDCGFGITSNEFFNKMYWFHMDSDSLVLEIELHIDETGLNYYKID